MGANPPLPGKPENVNFNEVSGIVLSSAILLGFADNTKMAGKVG
jgi:hypothetical protein